MTAETRLWYTYQGFTNDGRNLVSFFYPVTTARLPKQADMSAAEMDKFNSDPQAYIKAQAEMLNALSPADWQPDLTQLDKLVGSLQIQGHGCDRPAEHHLAMAGHDLVRAGGHRPKAEPDRRPDAVPGDLQAGRHPGREGRLQQGFWHLHLRRWHGGGRPGANGPDDDGRVRPRLALPGADPEPDGRAGLTACSLAGTN